MPQLNPIRSPFGTYIPKYSARNRWAIGDIHGCVQTFEALLHKIDFRRKDQLFLLGDYINKGPDTLGVLDQIMLLQQERYSIFPVRGNHEQIFLDFCAEKEEMKAAGKPYILAEKVLTPALLDSDDTPIQRYNRFINTLPHYCETEDFFTVHTNFNYQAARPFWDTDSMLYSLNFEVDKKWVGEKVVLHGHLPYSLFDIQIEVAEKRRSINLDNGCVLALQPKKFRPGTGNLCALNLDSYELLVQENID